MDKDTSPSTLTTDEMALWRGFLAFNQAVLGQVARELLAETGLSAAEFQILVRLLESTHGSLEQREVASGLEWSASRVSHQLARMQARGQLTRTTQGAGHVVTVALTELGRTLVESALEVHAAAVRHAFLDALTPEHREAIAALAIVRH
jgi:DNA-binding MarR family transcriptional regulator